MNMDTRINQNSQCVKHCGVIADLTAALFTDQKGHR